MVESLKKPTITLIPNEDPPEYKPLTNNSKILEAQKHVTDVKNIMADNIDKMINQHEKLTELEDKSNSLKNEANIFKKTSSNVKRRMCFTNCKLTLIIVGIILALILVLIISICSNGHCK